MTHMKSVIKIIIPLFLYSQACFAKVESREFKRGVATVLFSSLGGAVLGLSTLSFYSQPQERISNIPIGALLGFVAGSGYLLYSAQQSEEPQTSVYEEYTSDWDQKHRRGNLYTQAPLQIQFSLDF